MEILVVAQTKQKKNFFFASETRSKLYTLLTWSVETAKAHLFIEASKHKSVRMQIFGGQ
jgi:hypothetical protein